MLNALQEVPEANRCLPFVSMFYTQPSTYVWHDQEATPMTSLKPKEANKVIRSCQLCFL